VIRDHLLDSGTGPEDSLRVDLMLAPKLTAATGCSCGLLLPFGFPPALFVCRALARRDLFECAPLGFHPHMGVPREHGARDVPGDALDDLVAGAGFGAPRILRLTALWLYRLALQHTTCAHTLSGIFRN